MIGILYLQANSNDVIYIYIIYIMSHCLLASVTYKSCSWATYEYLVEAESGMFSLILRKNSLGGTAIYEYLPPINVLVTALQHTQHW